MVKHQKTHLYQGDIDIAQEEIRAHYQKVVVYTVKNAVYRNTPGEQYFTVSMVTHTVTTETVKYCSPGVFSYTVFFTVYTVQHS